MRTAYKIILLLFLSVSVRGQDVYKTPSGEKYHLSTCRMVENVSQKISLGKAHELGLEACKICKPAQGSIMGVVSSTKAQGQAQTVQCKGVTQKGSRCKHMTRIANGYCYQHDPSKD